MFGDKKKYNVCLVNVKCTQDLADMSFTNQLAGEALEVSAGSRTLEEVCVCVYVYVSIRMYGCVCDLMHLGVCGPAHAGRCMYVCVRVKVRVG
jgi:hypothetical protein